MAALGRLPPAVGAADAHATVLSQFLFEAF